VPARTLVFALAAGALAAATFAAPAAAAGRPAEASHAKAVTASGTTASGPALRVGHARLRKCASHPLTYCGRLRVPLDYASAASPKIGIGYRWLPATGHAKGTILAVEGGPGYSSVGTEPEYRAQAGPLLRTRNMLLVNLRGTGSSTPVNCPGLEHAGPAQHGTQFNRLVAACGRQLNHTWRYRGTGQAKGGWVHASDLFNTAYSARDVAGVLHALAPGRVDLYGDSYGTWFSQVFSSRYPGLLRSVTLDSTYQVLGLDPWYTTTVITARRAFDQACAKWSPCAGAARRSGWSLVSALARRLNQAPVSGWTTTADGTRGRQKVTTLTLVNLINNAGFDPVVYQDLDAAARALLNQDDAAPLLRLAALSLGFDDTSEPLNGFSDGLFFAVSCTDYVQLFSRRAAPGIRERQYAAALRREPRGTFAPFTVAQWTKMDQYTEAYSGCLHWPTPTRASHPITKRPPLVPRRVPVLILSGTLDSLTPRLRGATVVRRQMGRSARLVTVANLTHVTEQDGNSGCAMSLYRRFVRRPHQLKTMNVSCAAKVSPVHATGTYPVQLASAQVAKAAPGNQAGRLARQAATVALGSVGDEISRWPLLSGSRDRGLLGGTVRFTGGQTLRITLHGVRPARDAVIDGTAAWNQATGAVTARLTVHPAGHPVVRLTAHWHVYAAPGQDAVITGRQGTRLLAATSPAP
jgi:pimeloyl-ACP methyl ester carboxylesterase